MFVTVYLINLIIDASYTEMALQETMWYLLLDH